MATKQLATCRLIHLHLSYHLKTSLHPSGRRLIPLAMTIHQTLRQGVFRYYCFTPYHKAKQLKESLGLLGLDEECSSAEAKEAYLELAKRYHPDGQSKSANPHMFSKVKEAYQVVSGHLEKQASNPQEEDKPEVQEFDIKHTAPQHRQYPDFEGYGTGSPHRREKQYQAFRASRAAGIAMEHKVEKLASQDEQTLMVMKDKRATRRFKTTNTIDRMVEDLIQQSMAKGEFNDLPGKGKPLPNRTGHNPFMDISQHNLNRVLADNGYAPEWILLQKDIHSTHDDLKKVLLKERLKLGPEPLNDYNVKKWQGLRDQFEVDIVKLNKTIDNFNLIVPIIKLQMFHLRAQKELDYVIKKYNEVKPPDKQASSIKLETEEGRRGPFLKMIDKLGEKILDRIMPPP